MSDAKLERKEDADRKRAEKLKVELLGKAKKQLADLTDTIARLEEVVLTGSTSTDAVWLWWLKCWERKMDCSYTGNVAQGKAVIRRLLKTFSAVQLQHMIVRYIAEADDWTQRNAYPVGGLERGAARLAKGKGGLPQSVGFLEDLEREGFFTE